VAVLDVQRRVADRRHGRLLRASAASHASSGAGLDAQRDVAAGSEQAQQELVGLAGMLDDPAPHMTQLRCGNGHC
jgi:hypothetical protein